MSPARRTIAPTNHGDYAGETPQWILDALKVGVAHRGSALKLTSIL
jgi:hypothetical protein